jgi:FlaA1/EpsC-like NDP-sugar epimerase
MPSTTPRLAAEFKTSMWNNILLRRVQFALDLSVLIGAFFLAYLLRFEFDIPRHWVHPMLVQLPCVVLMQFVALNLAGVHSFVWRYVGITEVRAFFLAGASVFLILVLVRFGIPTSMLVTWRVPLSICVMDTVLAFGAVLGLRVLRRSSYEVFEKRKRERAATADRVKERVLLIGAGRAGVLASKEILNRGDMDLQVVGFIDDDVTKQGSVINRIKVVGKTTELPRLVRQLDVHHVIITMAQASRQDIQRITRICEEIPVKVQIIPGLYELLDGRVQISLIRDVQIEDLLGREPIQLDVESLSKELTGKIVMVTGAGGSIGSELARQVVRFSPAKLLLIERAEFALFNIDRALRESDPARSIEPLVADIGDLARMRSIFQTYRPEVVIHAAAHKHVPLMETNPFEAIKNNVLNTRRLSELADEFESEVFVLISTDKAVRATSIMGASKRLAELVVQDIGTRSKTRFVAVRFGNVIGSNGSAIPIFQEQIRKGGPLTITDKRMRRYFMTIPEAAQLVLQASTIGNGGEVFILHMGEPVSILELAEALILLSGMKPHEDIKIVEIGIRPGEKLNEELTFETEAAAATSHPKIFISKLAPADSGVIQCALQSLSKLVEEQNESELRRVMNEIIPGAQLRSTMQHELPEQGFSVAAHGIS